MDVPLEWSLQMKHPEHELQKAVVKYLRHQYPNVIIQACSPDLLGGGKLAKIRAAIAKALGYTKGFPDLVIYERASKPDASRHFGSDEFCAGLAIEFKTAKGRQSKEQKEVQKKLEAQGWKYEIIRDFDSAKQRIDEYLHWP